ncbi:hypothetical protein AWB69_03882 [Caballeronia udeis]|uniref:QacE-like protein n=1 Tax=Caballeronia udeis TaxID=1232866 RepID=A0A158H4N2_9BURK|nr:DUF6232 family protein [Caballeronia udeis]SAL39288.1 hypothetical protein AWB69_03882 [Caballeronia udeis]
MDERTFFDENGLRITNARFITPAQTYAMSGVTSVKREIKAANRGPGIIIAIIGLIVFFAMDSGTAKLAAGVAFCLGVALAVMVKDLHYVVIHSASGESRATESKDKGLIDRIIRALNDSIIARG